MQFNNQNEETEKLLELEISEVKIKNEVFDIEIHYESKSNKKLKIPEFILNQKTIWEKSKIMRNLFCCCICCYRTKYIGDISQKYLESYYKLIALSIQNYDSLNKSHEEDLKNLYLLCLKTDLTLNLKNEEWKLIGFQSSDPRTDFRGAGYLSLLFIIYFHNKFNFEFIQMIEIKYFMFAIICIKITVLFYYLF